MPFSQTEIEGLIVFQPRIFADDRGYFFESYNQKLFSENGITADFVQDNQSFSTYGTIRGLHFQTGESAQAKLVRVIDGEVLDVAVDIRPNSQTFGKHFSIVLSGENQKQFFIPRGFAHGFSVLSETAIFSYKCDNFYDKQAESGLIYSDEYLNIDWQIPADKCQLSEKDLLLPTFKTLFPN
jgi:dTDP-4-dehydrorhamnose 3,5-epimerase